MAFENWERFVHETTRRLKQDKQRNKAKKQRNKETKHEGCRISSRKEGHERESEGTAQGL